MIQVTKLQRENLLYVMNTMWPAVPKESVTTQLDRWQTRAFRMDEDRILHVCGTTHCLGGYCAIDPYFKAQGVEQANSGAPRIPGEWFGMLVARPLFGVDWLFNYRGGVECHVPEEMLEVDRNTHINDWEVINLRCQYLLQHSEVVP